MTYEEFCTKKEIVTNNFRKNKWRTESGSFTYPRGKKTLDTLKDIIDIVSTEDDVFHDSESVESEAGIDIEANSSSESEMTVLPEEDSADKSSGSKISHEGTADFMPTDIEDFEDNLPFI